MLFSDKIAKNVVKHSRMYVCMYVVLTSAVLQPSKDKPVVRTAELYLYIFMNASKLSQLYAVVGGKTFRSSSPIEKVHSYTMYVTPLYDSKSTTDNRIATKLI